MPLPTNPADDQALIEATEASGALYYGLALTLDAAPQAAQTPSMPAAAAFYLQQTAWAVTVQGDPRGFYRGTAPLLTFPRLASAARGLGYLNLKPDRDGVFRRLPLLVRVGDAFYPSLAFRSICDYLHVAPDQVVVRPGTHILLRHASRPGAPAPHDIVIPIDAHGNMRINYVGPWERLKHYHFAEVARAAEDASILALWREELAGKLAVVADVSTGASDIGPTPLDAEFPLSGVHTNVMHTILTEQFLHELSFPVMFCIEALCLVVVALVSWRLSSLWLVPAMLGVVVGYVSGVAVAFCYGQILLHLIRPLLLLVGATIGLTLTRYLAEKEVRGVERLACLDDVWHARGARGWSWGIGALLWYHIGSEGAKRVRRHFQAELV